MRYLRKQITEVPTDLIGEINKAYEFAEKFLEGQKWIAGDNVTIADFSLVATITSLDYHVKIDSKVYPNITEWLKRAQALPWFSSDHEQLQCFVDVFNNVKEDL